MMGMQSVERLPSIKLKHPEDENRITPIKHTKDYPSPSVVRPTVLVFNPGQKVEYMAATDMSTAIPKMGNPIIQRALE